MEQIFWPVLLLAIGLGLLAMELFVPSAGVLTIASVICLVAAIIVGFTKSMTVGVGMLGITMVIIPAALAAAVRLWPHTPIGRLILLARPDSPDDVLPNSQEYRGLKQLVGKVGVAETPMLPSGIVRVEGETYDALSEGTPIDPGSAVLVVDVRTNRLVVRHSSEMPSSTPEQSPQGDDLLSRPLDSFGIDGFDEPLS